MRRNSHDQHTFRRVLRRLHHVTASPSALTVMLCACAYHLQTRLDLPCPRAQSGRQCEPFGPDAELVGGCPTRVCSFTVEWYGFRRYWRPEVGVGVGQEPSDTKSANAVLAHGAELRMPSASASTALTASARMGPATVAPGSPRATPGKPPDLPIDGRRCGGVSSPGGLDRRSRGLAA